MSEIENGRLGLNDTEHLKCNRLMNVGFKGLTHLQETYCLEAGISRGLSALCSMRLGPASLSLLTG